MMMSTTIGLFHSEGDTKLPLQRMLSLFDAGAIHYGQFADVKLKFFVLFITTFADNSLIEQIYCLGGHRFTKIIG